MKGLFLLGLLSASIFLGNSQAHASVDSVGVIGPNGSVLHVSQNISGKILLQRCTPYTVLAKTVNEAQRTCSPVTWKYFSKETFRNIIRDSIIKFELKNLKTLSQAEINSCTNLNGFETDDKISEATELENDLAKINDFIIAYGEGNADLSKKAEIEKKIKASRTQVSGIKKIDAEVERIFSLVLDKEKVTLALSTSNEDKILYNVLNDLAKYVPEN